MIAGVHLPDQNQLTKTTGKRRTLRPRRVTSLDLYLQGRNLKLLSLRSAAAPGIFSRSHRQ